MKQFEAWKNLRIWVVCGKNKLPIDPRTFNAAKADDPETWGTYEEAAKASKAYSGIVGLYPIEPLVCIDLDDCIDDSKNEVRTETAREIMEMFKDSYISMSKSGHGLHIWCRGYLDRTYPQGAFQTPDGQKIEIYQTHLNKEEKTVQCGHYIAEPGNGVNDNDIAWQSRQLSELIAKYGKKNNAASAADDDDELMFYNAGEWKEKTPEEHETEIRSALEAIDPAGLDYTKWLEVGQALKASGISGGLELWEAWSRRDPDRYRADGPDSCTSKWESFKKSGITEKTIFQMAYASGWTSPVKSEPISEKEEQKAAEDLKARRIEIYKRSSLSASAPRILAELAEQRPRISTGLHELDVMLKGGIFPELYLLCAESGTGKSAFTQCLAESVAKAGHDVIYFALEMGRREIYARGVSRLMYEENKDDAVPFSDMLFFNYSDLTGVFSKVPVSRYRAAAEKYEHIYGSHLYVVENTAAGLTAKQIYQIVMEMVEAEIVHEPLIIIDYLQYITADPDDRAQIDRKTKTDVSIKMMKALSIKHGLPVWCISSVNRISYGERVTLASAKESGDLEFTAGVCLGLNNDLNMLTAKKKDEARFMQVMEEERKKQPRMVSVDMLKFRNAPNSERVCLEYHSAFNAFEPCPEEDRKKQLNLIRERYDSDFLIKPDAETPQQAEITEGNPLAERKKKK